MLRCYFVGLCVGSAVDGASNNVTLFSMIEGYQVALPFDVAGNTPFEAHAYVEFDEPIPRPREVVPSFELRFVWVDPDNRATPATDTPVIVPMTQQRMRLRSLGAKVPPAPGYFQLFAEWREAGGGDWTRSPQGWPVDVTAADPTEIRAGIGTPIPPAAH